MEPGLKGPKPSKESLPYTEGALFSEWLQRTSFKEFPLLFASRLELNGRRQLKDCNSILINTGMKKNNSLLPRH
ncbi:hypothetical protein QG37_05062 [Candidozyma auris]|nr:hypothetical protein QG37_05062 [[Candida] auris]